MFDIDSLYGFIDRYFGIYENNSVSSVKIGFEIISWLTVNFMLELISVADFPKALHYVNNHIAKRQERI